MIGERQGTERTLGLWRSTALVVGNMIGSGIFLLPAALAGYGGISILGWLFTSTGAMLLALVFARLSRRVPKVGGLYVYTRLGFGDFAGFLVAWGYWISIWCGNAAIATAFVGYMAVFVPRLTESPLLGAATAGAAPAAGGPSASPFRGRTQTCGYGRRDRGSSAPASARHGRSRPCRR